MNRPTILICLMILPFWSIAQKPIGSKDLLTVCEWMSGTFNSEKQAQKDSAFFNITLHMKPIWAGNRTDGYWFYVEQAVTQLMDKPYRQRVYHVFIQDRYTIVSQVYELKNPKGAIGCWKENAPLQHLSTDSLELRNGCAIYLRKISKSLYAGSTPGKECLSSLRGAAYATSEVSIYPNRIVSWDRGWNAEDQQVWGAIKGGYEFLKIETYPLK